MPNIINLTCPSCGGKLQLTSDIDRFACGFCGNELIVQRGGGIITLAPVMVELKEVRSGVNKAASELALARLDQEIKDLEAMRINANPPNRMGYIFLGICSIILFLLWVADISTGDMSSAGILFVIAAILALVAYSIYYASKNNVNQKVDPIDQAILNKQKERNHHIDIINGRIIKG